VDTVDGIVKEDRVVARYVLRVFLRRVGDADSPRDQELTSEAVDLLSAPRPQGDVVDTDRLIGVIK
jgi:hypothetical protein